MSEKQSANPDLCEHLRPVMDDLRAQGAKLLTITTPWSRNCRHWAYFADVVLDAESLKARLKLAECVAIHSHRGTVDGAEHGLVCQEHFDAVMGVHPELAGQTSRRIK